MKMKILGLAMVGLLLSGCAKEVVLTTTTAPTTTTTTTAAAETTTIAETTTVTTTTTAAFSTPAYDFSDLLTPAEGTELTAEALDVGLTLTQVDAEGLTLSLENRTGHSIKAAIPAFTVNGMRVESHQGWTLKAEEVLQVQLALPEHAFKWLGYENVQALSLENFTVTRVTDVPYVAESKVQETVELYQGALPPALGEQPRGAVLWEGDAGCLTLLGVEYDDGEAPRLMVKLESFAPAEGEAPALWAELTMAESSERWTVKLEKPGMTVAALKLAPAGELESLKVAFTLSDSQVGSVIESGEMTVDVQTLTLWGDPEAWTAE